MKETYKLKEILIPEDKHLEEEYRQLPKNNIFMSEEFYTPDIEKNKDKRALVLIQGTGAVRAGIWARSVCINESLETGSMLPFLKIAQKLEIPVLVMNPNLNRVDDTIIPYSQNMQVHAVWVWDKYVKDSGFKSIDIVAHSAGGGCLQAIMKTFEDTFWQQANKIAYTDSWVIGEDQINEEQKEFMKKNAVHYEASSDPVGTPQKSMFGSSTCPKVSAGHPKHEYTTGYS